ncbi:MAG: histidine kinase [Lachnospiraceae bacterium]|nr:histidine kinase [Lachnospiraceae bacterium]
MWKRLKSLNIRQQLYSIYFIAIFLPITIIGTFLLVNNSRILTNYHHDLLDSDNQRVKTILFEITTQFFNISRDIAVNRDIQDILTRTHDSERDFIEHVNDMTILEQYTVNYADVEVIEIYTDNPTVSAYKQFIPVCEDIAALDWYQKALNQASVFWLSTVTEDRFGNEYWNLCLVQRIPLVRSGVNAVIVLKVSDNYLKTRLDSGMYKTTLSVDDNLAFFSSNREDYGKPQKIEIDLAADNFSFRGDVIIDGIRYMAEVSTQRMYQSESKVYITVLDNEAYRNIRNITSTSLAIIILSIIIPGIIIHFFTIYFTRRIFTLREAMHRVSQEDYVITDSVKGADEVSEAFADLEIMVEQIKEKDARMYETLIKEKDLENEQQVMEFKMLASQINPHFLYNALETIRMKAFTTGDKEVATAIKLLGKIMRYVLENTGTNFTTLEKEISHIETYLAIQKLRFGEKFVYHLDVAPEISLQEYNILPLLLQPVVENAVLHGLEEMESDGVLRIHIYQEAPNLIIEIKDNGGGMTAQELNDLKQSIEIRSPEKSTSIGLYNINQRMKLCYGEQYGIEIVSNPGAGTCVRMMLPV